MLRIISCNLPAYRGEPSARTPHRIDRSGGSSSRRIARTLIMVSIATKSPVHLSRTGLVLIISSCFALIFLQEMTALRTSRQSTDIVFCLDELVEMAAAVFFRRLAGASIDSVAAPEVLRPKWIRFRDYIYESRTADRTLMASRWAYIFRLRSSEGPRSTST